MRFARYLVAGAVASLVIHGSGSAFFADDPNEILIAASQGGGVSVIGSIEDLVAGAKVETVADDEPVEKIEPEEDPLDPVQDVTKTEEVPQQDVVKPVGVQPLQSVAEPVDLPEAVDPLPALPVVAGVTTTDPVTALEIPENLPPIETPPAEQETKPVEMVKPPETVQPAEPLEPVEQVTVAAVKPVEPVAEQKPVEIAQAEVPEDPDVLKPVEPQPEVQEPVVDPLMEVTQTPKVKPKPPVRKAQKKTKKKKAVKAGTTQKRGTNAQSRKGGERVTSNSAKGFQNGRADGKSKDGGTRARSNYKGKVSAKLRRAKRYPKEASRKNIKGTVVVTFVIASSGSVSGIRVVRSSGNSVLDRAGIDMVRRASPMPKFPKDISEKRMPMTVPIQFGG
ncbi:energy transducer TonB [Roseibium aggregatum]|uniref:Protein TonB n=1 Tax=Roseibium aggregatum TaxID=187304 RepID=A0A939EHE2_9HYPH|nr:energy transducer TonB [Roseibium aggregatum]MBN9672293.1 TonB family protein [Roseibium aggregatum]